MQVGEAETCTPTTSSCGIIHPESSPASYPTGLVLPLPGFCGHQRRPRMRRSCKFQGSLKTAKSSRWSSEQPWRNKSVSPVYSGEILSQEVTPAVQRRDVHHNSASPRFCWHTSPSSLLLLGTCSFPTHRIPEPVLGEGCWRAKARSDR